ncbi:MAG: PEP-CTERM sorting domain-containing protein [Pirellulales bacterium]
MQNRYLIVCALLSLCASAQGATIWTGANFRVDASAPVPVGNALQGVTLTAIGLNGALPNAFDGVTGGATGITTAGNLLSQVYEFAPMGSPTPTLALIQPVLNAQFYPIDSHFLVDPPAIISTVAPNENQLVANNTEAPNAGYGNSLTGQFALSGAPAASWAFAYLAVPDGTTVNLNFRIADGGGQFANELVETSLVVPEPSTMLLGGVGMLAWAALAWRRRR